MKKQIINKVIAELNYFLAMFIILLLVFMLSSKAHAQTVVTLPQNTNQIRVYWFAVQDTDRVSYKVYLKYKDDPPIPYPENDTTLVFERAQVRDSSLIYVASLDESLNESEPSGAVMVHYETVPAPPNPPGEYLAYRIDNVERINLNYVKVGNIALWLDPNDNQQKFAMWGYNEGAPSTVMISTTEKLDKADYRISITGSMYFGSFDVIIGNVIIPVALSTSGGDATTSVVFNVPVAGQYTIIYQSTGSDVVISNITYQRSTADHTPPPPVGFIRVEKWTGQ